MMPGDPFDNPVRPLVGLYGPAVSINLTGAEIDALRPLGETASMIFIDSARDLLRELDIRHGAALELQPDRPRAEVTVPLSSGELAELHRIVDDRAAYRGQDNRHTVTMRTLLRDLDRRMGAAQAAAATLAAAGAAERLDRLDATTEFAGAAEVVDDKHPPVEVFTTRGLRPATGTPRQRGGRWPWARGRRDA